MKTATIIVVLLIIAAFIVGNSIKVDLGEKEGRETLIKATGKWLLQVGRNIKGTVAFVAKQQWLPKVNETA